MEPDTQAGQEVELDAAESAKVDLNTAGIERLCLLPGIGPQLAMRILDHRAIQGPFLSPEDLTQVPGIGTALYERLADHVTVSAPVTPVWELAPAPMPDVEDTLKLPRVTEPPDVAEGAVEGEPVADEETVQEEAAAMEKPGVPEPSTPPSPARPQPRPTVPPAASAPVPQRSGVSFWILLGVALAGGLLGMLFSLLVLSGINGSLDVAHSRAVITLNGQVEDLTARLDSLQGDVDGLRRRLSALEGLTARMEKVETAAADLQDDFDVLDEKTDVLSGEVTGLSEKLEVVAAETEKAGTFFQGLQTLMADIFGAGAAVPTATPTPNE